MSSGSQSKPSYLSWIVQTEIIEFIPFSGILEDGKCHKELLELACPGVETL